MKSLKLRNVGDTTVDSPFFEGVEKRGRLLNEMMEFLIVENKDMRLVINRCE